MQLYQYLIEAGVSQNAFANKIGVSQPTLHRYLIGSTYPTVVKAIKIEAITNKKVKVHDWANLDRHLRESGHD
jgi:transcriptional regulator with XRE-family HTH domain